MGVGGDAKQIANDGLRLGVVVDVANDIANAVKDNQVGLVDEDGGLDQPESLLPVYCAQIIKAKLSGEGSA